MVRASGLGGDGHVERDDRKRLAKCCGGRARSRRRDRNVEAELCGAAAEELRIGNDVKSGDAELPASVPDRQREVGADTGGLAERQSQR